MRMGSTKKRKRVPELLEDVAWLGNVQEVRHPISQTRPLWVRQEHILSGSPLTEPAMPQPEWHPYCEFSCVFEGEIRQYVGGEKIEKKPGDIMLLSGGTPHYAMYLSFPLRYITVYFLPALIFELGPEGDGARAMTRFIAAKTLADCVVRLHSDLNETIMRRFEQMAVEFAVSELGSEFRLRALLLENLVDLLRWEKRKGRAFGLATSELKWNQVERALRYIHEHYGKPLYVAQIARESGLSASHLQETFKQALGMSCIQYLRGYRISHAAALLQATDVRVTEIALEVGFESLGHFNASFRTFLGKSPTEYRIACKKNQQ